MLLTSAATTTTAATGVSLLGVIAAISILAFIVIGLGCWAYYSPETYIIAYLITVLFGGE